MPTSLAGKTTDPRRGVTLIELLIVITIISFMAGISYPSLAAGVDTLRLNGAADEIAGLFNAGLNRAERRLHAVEIALFPVERVVELASADLRFRRRLDLPSGVSIAAILPEIPGAGPLPRRFLLYPGGSAPRVGVVVANGRGDRRLIRIDPISGVPVIQRLDRDAIP
jgi:prepilin-type N-terminal cleavage/methylation domain-containing protein